MPKRKRALTPTTFFPRKGDVLVNTEDGSNWTCAHLHVHIDTVTGTKIRYALLIGRQEDLGDTPIPRLWHSHTDMRAELAEIDYILRRQGKEDDMVRYDRTEKGTFTAEE